jgi:hypothetical protein
VAAAAAALHGPFAHGVPELRGDDDLVAATLKDLPEDLLGAPSAPVDVRRVEEVDAQVERLLDHGPGLIRADAAAEVVAAQADDRDFEARSAEATVLHVSLLPSADEVGLVSWAV